MTLLTGLTLGGVPTPRAMITTPRVGNLFARSGGLSGTLAPKPPPPPPGPGCGGMTFGPVGADFSVDLWSATGNKTAVITLPSNSIFAPGALDTFTVECWVKVFNVTGGPEIDPTTGDNSPYEGILSFPAAMHYALPPSWLADTGALSALYCMDFFPNGFRSPQLWPPGTTHATTPPLLTLSTWYHFAITFDPIAQRSKFYVNGVRNPANDLYWPGGALAFMLGSGAPVIGNTNPVGYGIEPLGGTPQSVLRGRLSDLRVWNIVRTDVQIGCAYNHRLLGTEPGLVSYWPMDDGTGTTIADATGGGATGTFSSATDITWVADAPTFVP